MRLRKFSHFIIDNRVHFEKKEAIWVLHLLDQHYFYPLCEISLKENVRVQQEINGAKVPVTKKGREGNCETELRIKFGLRSSATKIHVLLAWPAR